MRLIQDEDSDGHILSNKLTMFGMEITILLRRLFLWPSLSFSLTVDFLNVIFYVW